MRATQGKSLTRKKLRSFGLLIGGVFGVLWMYRYLVHGSHVIPLLLLAGALIVLGLLYPRALLHPFRVWMWAGERIGAVVSRIILAVCYFLILTPIALIRRCFVRDPLELRVDSDRESYFHEKRIQPRQQLKRMF